MSQPRHTARLPAFTPVHIKRRADGWTPVRQAGFIGKLAETGSVSAAAEFVGMARETAYRLRARPGAEEFARAWNAALAIAGRRTSRADECATLSPSKVTDAERLRRLKAGRWRPVLRRGKYIGCVYDPQNSALLRHAAQFRQGSDARLQALLRAGMRLSKDLADCHPAPSASPPAME